MKLDVRGLSCPEPVLQVRQAIESGNKELEIYISEAHTRTNVEALLKRMHIASETREADGEFIITTHA